jgi:anti-sigma regulatory factor (Ser/Thr protein kinase)
MEVVERENVAVKEPSDVGHLRRLAGALAARAGFGEVETARVAIAATEASTNLLKHAGGGEVLLRRIEDGAERGIDLIALDAGPGIEVTANALRDGFSTAGTAGSGLGAIARQSSWFDVYSAPGAGTAVLARFWSDGRAATNGFTGAVSVPKPGERRCGDDWSIADERDVTTALVVDGLGHGPAAADASMQAKQSFRRHAGATSVEILQRMHEALRPTRGAAAAIARIDRAKRVVRFAGIGNVAGVVIAGDTTRIAVSQFGTLGHDVRKIQEFQYPWPAGALLVLHSDGLGARWTLKQYPGLSRHDATLIAAVLYRDARRGNDDTTVLVIRDRS